MFNKLNSRSQGFTIVELLIVIVVIGILAAITIVSFNGITLRAENTKTISGVEQYANALRIYQSDNGAYPVVSASNPFYYACIAEAGDTCGMVAGAAGTTCNNLSTAYGTTDLNNLIKTVIPKIPAVSNQTMNCDGKTVKGAFYYVLGAPDKNGFIVYYLKGDQPCVTPAGSSLVSGGRVYWPTGTTSCNIVFAG